MRNKSMPIAILISFILLLATITAIQFDRNLDNMSIENSGIILANGDLVFKI